MATHSPPFDTAPNEQNWAALLRYDAYRRGASERDIVDHDDHNDAQQQQHTNTFHKLSKVKQMHVGDDLPHMPEDHHGAPPRSTLPKGAQKPHYLQQQQDGDETQEDPYEYEDGLTLGREVTPLALKGENAILVGRELERLRERRPKEVRMKWRVTTGLFMLLVMAFTAYMVAQYARTYLALSPANWFLSDAQEGTRTSPDPLLRSIAMLELVLSALALLGILASGFYLRMTRRRSCGRGLIWFTAIISTTLNVALSLANIALIVGWHKQYVDNSTDPLAHTRDVGQRCNGVWDLDILWGAASSSLVTKEADAAQCPRDSAKTMQMFLIAGGVRLAVFVVLCSAWLMCLGRYNATSQMLDYSSNDSIDQSPEMHLLLSDERGGHPATAQHVPGSYRKTLDADADDLPHFPESHYSHSTLAGPPPKLDKFAWQRGEASHAMADDQVHVYGNVGKAEYHQRDHSAGAWSTHIMDRLWGALWGGSGGGGEDGQKSLQVDEEKNVYELEPPAQHPWYAQWHTRENTRLGVRGWFGVPQDDEEVEPAAVAAAEHERTSSQSRRADAERHAAARRVQQADPYTAGLGSRSLSRKAALERAERRKQEQRDRIAFLASFHHEEDDDVVPPLPPPKQARRHSDSSHSNSDGKRRSFQSQGDSLPAMPQLLSVPAPLASSTLHAPSVGPGRVNSMRATTAGQAEEYDDEDESEFWRPPSRQHGSENGDVDHQGAKAPVFVRQLGKLVRRLSAIESVGSGGERSHDQSRNSREPSSGSALY